MSKIGFISFRLGGTDGVSIVASHWIRAVAQLGHETYTIAGVEPADRVIPGLAIDSSEPPSLNQIREAISELDLVIVENLLTIPMNLEASVVVAEALAGRAALLHHHDPPWQRERFADITALPVDDPAWLHVTINQTTADEFMARGIAASSIWNCFEPPTHIGDRDALRRELEVSDDELLALHPVRAIERKNIPGALKFCEAIGATYWLLGEAEEGYNATLQDLLANTSARVIRGTPVADLTDSYAACDFVLFPSHYEGFGNPPFEAALHRKPAVVGHYPVLNELSEIGLEFYDVDAPEQLAAFLQRPDKSLLERNEGIVRSRLSFERTKQQLHTMLGRFGITDA